MKLPSLAPLALAALLAAALSFAAEAAKPALPFLEDDYAKALAEARARQVPIFIEAWAPW